MTLVSVVFFSTSWGWCVVCKAFILEISFWAKTDKRAWRVTTNWDRPVCMLLYTPKRVHCSMMSTGTFTDGRSSKDELCSVYLHSLFLFTCIILLKHSTFYYFFWAALSPCWNGPLYTDMWWRETLHDENSISSHMNETVQQLATKSITS